MASIPQQIKNIETLSRTNLALINGTRNKSLLHVFMGSGIKYGCGISILDSLTLKIDPSIDPNPHGMEVSNRSEYYQNIAMVDGEVFLSDSDKTLSLIAADLPSVGFSRIDTIYLYVGEAGPALGMLEGTSTSTTPSVRETPKGTLKVAEVTVDHTGATEVVLIRDKILNADDTRMAQESAQLSAQAAANSEQIVDLAEQNVTNLALEALQSKQSARESEINAENFAIVAQTAKEGAVTSAQEASTYASHASSSATDALSSKQSAKASEDNAENSSINAGNFSIAAENSAIAASQSASAAASSAAIADEKAIESANSAANALSSKVAASSSATESANSAVEASSSAQAAQTSATNASLSLTDVESAKSDAVSSAAEALASQQSAKTSEENAESSSVSASSFSAAAESSAIAAASSASAAASSASTADEKATESANSAANVISSKVAASASATEAADSAAQALSSAQAAESSATNASVSATDAENAKNNANSSATDASSSALSAATSESNSLSFRNDTELLKNEAQTAKIEAEEASSVAISAADTASLKADQAVASANYQGVWESNINYSVGQSVIHNGIFWVSNTGSINNEPNTANPHWSELPNFEYLQAIDKEMAQETIAAVHIYDTTQDFDKGVWAYQSTNCSWWNEALNTAERGAKRAFPRVALIMVPYAGEPVIYDATEADMPMWKVLKGSSISSGLGVLYDPSNNLINSVKAVNGELFFSTSSAAGLCYFDFKNDVAGKITTSSSFTGHVAPLNLYQDTPMTISDRKQPIIHTPVNDIAVVSDISGHNILYVATDNGLSRIDGDGSVSHWTDDGNSVNMVRFLDVFDNYIYWTAHNNGAMYYGLCMPIDKKLLDFRYNDGEYHHYRGIAWTEWQNWLQPIYFGGEHSYIKGISRNAFITQRGLIQIIPNYSSWGHGLINLTTPDHISGWQYGDIRAAWLGSNSTEVLNGVNLLVNGTFETDSSGWNAQASAALELDSGSLKITNNTADYGSAGQSVLLKKGTYRISAFYDHNHSNDQSWLKVGSSSNADDIVNISTGIVSDSATGFLTGIFTIDSDKTVYISLQINNITGKNGLFDDVVLLRCEPDLSYNNSPLTVFGDINKEPVADGAELVGFSGFSTDNYFHQSYTSKLDFGIGDFYWIGWIKKAPHGVNEVLFERGGIRLSFNHLDELVLEFNDTQLHNLSVSDQWFQLVVSRNDGLVKIYINGKETFSAASDINVSGSNAEIYIGKGVGGNPLVNGSVSLLRLGAGAPTVQQIESIYWSEKSLFIENTKFSTSALDLESIAFDKTENILYEGSVNGYTARADGQLTVCDSGNGDCQILDAETGFLIQGN